MWNSENRKPPALLCAFLIGAGLVVVAWTLLEGRINLRNALFILFLLCSLSVGMLVECWRWIICYTRRRSEDFVSSETARLRSEIVALTLEREISLVAASGCDPNEAATRIIELLGLGFNLTGGAVFVADSEDLTPLFARWGRKRGQSDRTAQILPSEVVQAALKAYHRSAQITVKVKRKSVIALPFGGEDGARGVLVVAVPVKEAKTALYLCRQVLRPVSVALRVPTLYKRAVFDGLTGLYSRRHLESELPRMFEEARRLNTPLSVIMLDIDHFKNINDRYGHKTGDLVLAGVARVVRSMLRSYDAAFRYGGEEFCIVLPRTALQTARKVAERIRNTVAHSVFRSTKNESIPVTISCGVATLTETDETHTSLVERADEALYEAKRNGRNQTVCAKHKTHIPQTKL